MLLGCIADDFTGASDLANTLAKGGMATVQFVGVPDSSNTLECDAGVVALKTRSVAASDAVAQSLHALSWLQKRGCQQFLFKYCSTFDSTPEGNIGPVAEALLDALEAPVAVVCPVFPATGRTLYMGHLFVGDRLLSESGMQNHPITPMTDPDVRRWLSRQTSAPAGLIPHPIVRQGAASIARALDAEGAQGRRLVVVDALTDTDLMEIGAAVTDHRLVTGGSGIALGLPQNFRRAGVLPERSVDFVPIKGPGFVLSGSCSTASVRQVEEYRRAHPAFSVEPDAVMDGSTTVESAFAFAQQHWFEAPIIFSTAPPAAVAAAQTRHGREEVAAAVENLFAALALRLVRAGAARLIVGGGETSGAVVTSLGLAQLRIGPEIDPGVPALTAVQERPLALALKSGNFGAPDFYAKAMDVLGGGP